MTLSSLSAVKVRRNKGMDVNMKEKKKKKKKDTSSENTPEEFYLT
jgi:hypothetical protein